jgi:RNA polymerase sigma-70 factor (ECF subfamily)
VAEPADETEQWLLAAKAGSSEALGQALEACRRYLLLIARRELGEDLQAKASASDLVQQTFLEAQRDFGRFVGDSEAAWRAWLRRLLINNLATFAREYRATAKRDIHRELVLREGESSGTGLYLPAEQPSPSAEVMALEQAEMIRCAVDRLPDNYRRVLLLRYQAGKTFEEIGRLLGFTANAARKLLLRAVERVQRDLEGPP